MKIHSKTSTVLLGSLLLISAISGNMTQASTVKIINKSEQNLRVAVVSQSGGASYCKKCFDGRTYECGEHGATIQVPLESSKGTAYFSMIDVGNGLMGGGKCKNLSAAKDYEVIFFETTLGTDCESREI